MPLLTEPFKSTRRVSLETGYLFLDKLQRMNQRLKRIRPKPPLGPTLTKTNDLNWTTPVMSMSRFDILHRPADTYPNTPPLTCDVQNQVALRDNWSHLHGDRSEFHMQPGAALLRSALPCSSPATSGLCTAVGSLHSPTNVPSGASMKSSVSGTNARQPPSSIEAITRTAPFGSSSQNT